MGTVMVTTPACMVCDKVSTMEVDGDALDAWQNRRALIQNAFPDMSNEEREQLKTGTHPACWDKMFAGMEDD